MSFTTFKSCHYNTVSHNSNAMVHLYHMKCQQDAFLSVYSEYHVPQK